MLKLGSASGESRWGTSFQFGINKCHSTRSIGFGNGRIRFIPSEEVGAGVVEDPEPTMESVTILCARAATIGEEGDAMKNSTETVV